MEAIANLIIRPARSVYDLSVDLGPSFFTLKGLPCRRLDLDVLFTQLLNDRKQCLKCSWFQPISPRPHLGPCVIYCHGNCGNRLDASEILEAMIGAGMSVFAFDFAGSGLSDGQYVSLGVFEQRDIATVVTYLRSTGNVSAIALWGRSMGAVSAILYASTHQHIAALVLDSPFSSFREVTSELAASYRLIPTVLSAYFLEKVRAHVQRSADFDMYSINPIDNIPQCDMPALFIHAKDDRLVRLHHSERLFSLYPSHEKLLVKVNGSHNSTRPKPAYTVAAQFVKKWTFKQARRKQPVEDTEGLDTTRACLPEMVKRVREKIRKPAVQRV